MAMDKKKKEKVQGPIAYPADPATVSALGTTGLVSRPVTSLEEAAALEEVAGVETPPSFLPPL